MTGETPVRGISGAMIFRPVHDTTGRRSMPGAGGLFFDLHMARRRNLAAGAGCTGKPPDAMPLRLRALCLLALLTAGCNHTAPFVRPGALSTTGRPPTDPGVVTFYALGDWGTGDATQHAVAHALAADVGRLPPDRRRPPFALELGDNVYPKGLPAGWGNPVADSLLEVTFARVYRDVRYRGEMIDFHVVPGNHDYGVAAFDAGDGWGDVAQQATRAEARFPHWHYHPAAEGLPDTNDAAEYAALRARGPVLPRPEALAMPPVTLIALDTQALLDHYAAADTAALRRHWAHFDRLLAAAGPGWTVVFGHHPVRTHGRHGGFRTAEEWTWSGTRGLYAPKAPALRWLPLIPRLAGPFFCAAALTGGARWTRAACPAGLLVSPEATNVLDLTLGRYLLGKKIQDTDHPGNRAFQADLLARLARHHALYLAGHDHSLQLLEPAPGVYQVISGSAGKVSVVGDGADTRFAHAAPGFARLDATATDLWITFFAVDTDTGRALRTARFHLTR